MKRLLPHQRRLLARARRLRRLALFWEMRLGKTLAAIRWACRRNCDPVLVVAPLSVLPGWLDELREDGIEAVSLRDAPPRESGWHVVNYAMLRSRPELADHEWDCVILDESTTIRNPKSQISQLCEVEFVHVPNRAILSGYPAPESLLDVVQQFLFLNGRFLGASNYWQLRDRLYQKVDYVWYPKRGARKIIKREIRRLAFVLKRKDVDIGSETVYETRTLQLSAKEAKRYQDVERTFEFDGTETKWRVVVDQWLAQLAGSTHKDRELLSLLTGELTGEQVVVWFRYNSELSRISHKLKKAGITRRSIFGHVPYRERHRIVKDFHRGQFRVLLMQVKCGKFGLDLSCSDTAIYFSIGYEHEYRVQSIDRLVHPKKRRPVLVLDLVTADTIDEDIRIAHLEKKLEGGSIMSRVVELAKKRKGK